MRPPLPSFDGSRIGRGIDASQGAIDTKSCCRPRLPGGSEPVRAERPSRRLRRDASAAAQHVAGDGQLVGRGADVVAGVVQHQVLDGRVRKDRSQSNRGTFCGVPFAAAL